MTPGGLSIELRHAQQLCYAMQQSAVPWLYALELRNDGAEPLRALRVRVELVGFADPVECLVEHLGEGARLELDVPDIVLRAAAFAALDERVRTELVVEVEELGAPAAANDAAADAADDAADAAPPVLARVTRVLDVLAYNEWPGLHVLAPLLASFVLPNHPALTPLLHAVGEGLRDRTGDGGLDGYQSEDPERVRALLASVYDAVAAQAVRYVSAPPSFERGGQKVRTPEQVVGERLGTCLDLTLLFAALLEHCGLDPFVVLLRGHAFVGVWLRAGSADEQQFGAAVELRKGVAAGTMALCETTVACTQPRQPFERAAAAARQRLDREEEFVVAIDVEAARRAGFRPLPMRRSGYEVAVESAAGGDAASGPAPAGEAPVDAPPVDAPMVVAPPPPPPAANGPRDRLEHWQQKLLDLTMFNRLLNFVETKKTVALCRHDLGALEDRLQAGARVRVLPRPSLGDPSADPRDLALRAARSGEDLMADYLAEELKHGRLRADLDQEQLDVRLTEIFRHARTSLEESGANTLYVAIGFLRWFESDGSKKERRAPLLLLPIVVERLSMQEGYRFHIDDAEARVNTTLLQLLERDFDVRVPIGEQLPEDERGVDVGAVLDVFRDAALGMARWEVEDVAHIGFFSFTKYLMWRDLSNRDELLKSAVLRHLIEAPGAALPQDVPEVARDELDDLDPAEVFCPKDADSSQLSAVIGGAAGRSFVLEGPPGTGKSQTITNLIAQSLASGRRVLFVAEKRAALEVVHQRLSDVGLGPFCLELHSTKSGPKAVLEQLRRTLDLGHKRAPDDWQRVADDLQQQRERLNGFVLALHRRREHGWSVHQAMARLVELGDGPRRALPDLLEATPDEVAAARDAVDALVVAAGSLGAPCDSAWWGVRRGDWTPALTREAMPMARRLHDAAAAFEAALAPVVDALALGTAFGDEGPSARQLGALLALLRALQAPTQPPSDWLRLPGFRAFDEDLARAIAIGGRRDQLWAELAPRWRRELLELDLGGLAASYRLHADAFFLLRWWRLRGHKPVLAAVATGALGKAAAIRDDLERALRVRDEERDLRACTTAIERLGAAFRDGLADWATLDRQLQKARELRQLVLQLHPGALQADDGVLAAVAGCLDAAADGVDRLSGLGGALASAHDELTAARAQVGAHLELDAADAFGPDDAPGHVGRVAARAARWLGDEAGLRDQCAYRRAADAASAAHLAPVVDAHARAELGVHELRTTYERSLFTDWLDRVHEAEPELARFRGQDHEAAIARFAELDRRAIELGAEVVVARLAARLPRLRDTQVSGSELGVLERELKKQRRHKPVRRLLAEIRGLWPRLSPCVLMSPLSVAQFLDRDAQRFDLVVFDEASQIPMWDAVGAIGRGESLIVVGDSRQLPPTNFFQRVAQDDDREVEDVPEDLESVLDECGAAGLPRMHLDWHYRSRHESLIAFSNHHYYQNRLLTFPSPEPAGEGAGVRCVRVDGVYDRAGSQQNRVEAEALVAEVVRRLRDPLLRRRSVGIVTFSRSQQTLIEDLLDAERRADASLEAAIAEADEELFVKNLENVQGDERDVILFSICYGPDAAGKVYENYGPLNLQGGERRLNVAVTRARRELVVFTSVGPEQVANRSAATGARHLRNFLDYATRGEAALVSAVEHDPSRDVDSPFEASVRDALVARGYEVHTQVGCSGYRIDLGVVDPDAPGRYLLGVECDGATYHRAATARDRDRLRAAVLRGLGWQLVRVWSTDYWQDPRGELDRVEGEIEAARVALRARAEMAAAMADPAPSEVESGEVEASEDAGPIEAAAAVDEAPAAPDDEEVAVVAEAPPPDLDGPRDYLLAELGDVADDEEAAARLLRVEAPIVYDRFVRALADAWGLGRVTSRVRDRVTAACGDGPVRDGDVLWADDEQRRAFRGFRRPPEGADERLERSAEELPPVEVAHAVAWLLRQHHGVAEDDLMREAARMFGIQRLGNVVRDVMERAVAQVVEDGVARREEGWVRLREE